MLNKWLTFDIDMVLYSCRKDKGKRKEEVNNERRIKGNVSKFQA